MAEQVSSFASLRLSVEDREKIAEVTGELIAVQVYRELQRASERAKGSNGCNIIANCSSCSSKNALLGK